MKSDRRHFLLGVPASALLLHEFEGPLLSAPAASTAQNNDDAIRFWVHGMGLDPRTITSLPTEAVKRGASRELGATPEDFAREPIFLHFDETQKALVTTDQIPRTALLDSGDAQVDVQLQRLRMNTVDHAHFAKYSSGGIYLELQQTEQAAVSTAAPASSGLRAELIEFASTVFSAFFPQSGDSKHKATAPATKSPGLNFMQSSTSRNATATKAGTSIPLQNARQSQSLTLSNGSGKAAFSAFVKDRQRSAFGQFVAALTSSAGADSPYAQLLSIPMLATPALGAIRALVANLQFHGGDQAVLMQSPPIDIAATVQALSASTNALPLRNGSYIAIPREQGPLIKGALSDHKIMNGFLVPKDATDLDVTPELVQGVLPGITYLSLGIGVKKARAKPACA